MHQGRPRGAARPRLDLHGRGRRADRPRRLADDDVPDARRRAVSRRDVLPAAAAPRPAVVPRGAAGGLRRLAGAPGRRRPVGGRARRARALGRPRAAVGRAAVRGAARRGAAKLRRRVRRDVGRVGRRAEVPARPDARVPAPPRRDGAHPADARRDGGGRHVRPRRRRLPPLLGRRALARPALREDALRQRAPRSRLRAGLAGARRRALPRGGGARRSSTSCASWRSRAAASPRRRTRTRTGSRA